jgi:hypothetical protein
MAEPGGHLTRQSNVVQFVKPDRRCRGALRKGWLDVVLEPRVEVALRIPNLDDAFDPAVHRALEIVFFGLEDQLPRVDDTAAFEAARDDLRAEFREYWERRLPRPPK